MVWVGYFTASMLIAALGGLKGGNIGIVIAVGISAVYPDQNLALGLFSGGIIAFLLAKFSD